jgi:hypothetical protein
MWLESSFLGQEAIHASARRTPKEAREPLPNRREYLPKWEEKAVPAGVYWRQGWGGAALPALGLHTPGRMGHGWGFQGCRQNA